MAGPQNTPQVIVRYKKRDAVTHRPITAIVAKAAVDHKHFVFRKTNTHRAGGPYDVYVEK